MHTPGTAAGDQTAVGQQPKPRPGVQPWPLYRRPELRAIIEQHRHEGREALTLTGLQVQIDQLRLALEAVAAKARRHEEELRHLKRTR